MYCHNCFGQKIVKNGNVRGVQRYKCKNCGSNFTLVSNHHKYKAYSSMLKIEIIKHYLNGFSIRGMEKKCKISNTLILYWVSSFIIKLKRNLEEDFNNPSKNFVQLNQFYKTKLKALKDSLGPFLNTDLKIFRAEVRKKYSSNQIIINYLIEHFTKYKKSH